MKVKEYFNTSSFKEYSSYNYLLLGLGLGNKAVEKFFIEHGIKYSVYDDIKDNTESSSFNDVNKDFWGYEAIEYLKENNIPFCLATGSPLINVNFYFEALGIGRWFSFDNIVYCDGSFPGKPAPDIYKLAADRLGLDTSECAVFEDGTSGILSANAAGVSKVMALWEEGVPSPLTEKTRVDGIYHSLKDWKNILSSIGII